MPSAEPISGGTFAGLVGVVIFAGTVNDLFMAMRRGALSGVKGAGEEAISIMIRLGNKGKITDTDQYTVLEKALRSRLPVA